MEEDDDEKEARGGTKKAQMKNEKRLTPLVFKRNTSGSPQSVRRTGGKGCKCLDRKSEVER